MKKQYTKKQITEAIKHWKGVLRKMNGRINESSYYDKYKKQGVIGLPDLGEGLYLVSFSTIGYQNGDTFYVLASKEKISTILQIQFNEILSDIDSSDIVSFKKDVQRVTENILKDVDNVDAFSDDKYHNHFSSVKIGSDEYVTVDVKNIAECDDLNFSEAIQFMLMIAV